jgi:HK97 family phage major capsid protein
MPHQTDQMLSRCIAEIEERQQLIDSVIESAKGEDLSDEQLELVTRAKDRIEVINRQMLPLEEARRISSDSSERIATIAHLMSKPDKPREVEYRSAGEYALDMWQAGLGVEPAKDRLHRWGRENRAASHQLTSDNPGLIPSPILGPVINFIDASRPLVGQLGPRQLPNNSFSRPKITQHTAVAAQSAEKAELTSQKMTIGKLTPTTSTLGGYVNVSRQDIDWSQPQVMDIIIQDLAAQYAILTESTAVGAFYAAGTAGTVTIPATPTADNVAAALWGAAGQVYTATKGGGRLVAAVSPDVLGLLGPLFNPVNPQNAQSAGFDASAFGTGAAGSVAGITIVVTNGFGAAKRMMVMSTAAAEVYEDRVGALSVVEPSVLGVQVAYAGYFAYVVIEATGIIKVTVT